MNIFDLMQNIISHKGNYSLNGFKLSEEELLCCVQYIIDSDTPAQEIKDFWALMARKLTKQSMEAIAANCSSSLLNAVYVVHYE